MRTRTAICTTLLALAGITACSTGDGKPTDHAAAIMCEDFVKARLKSPSTADFPGVSDADYATTKVLRDTKPWRYQVTGVVDSQNGFGATVRSQYVCTVTTEDADTWTLNRMKIN